MVFYNAMLYHSSGKKKVASWFFKIIKLQCLLSLPKMKCDGLLTFITTDYQLYLQKRAFKRLSFITSEGNLFSQQVWVLTQWSAGRDYDGEKGTKKD